MINSSKKHQATRPPAIPPYPQERIESAPASSDDEGGAILWGCLILAVAIGLWRWNVSRQPVPPPQPPAASVSAGGGSAGPNNLGSGPGWWTEDDLPKDTPVNVPRSDSTRAARPTPSTDDGIRRYSQDEIGQALRDALLESLDTNRDGVIDVDEVE